MYGSLRRELHRSGKAGVRRFVQVMSGRCHSCLVQYEHQGIVISTGYHRCPSGRRVVILEAYLTHDTVVISLCGEDKSSSMLCHNVFDNCNFSPGEEAFGVE